MPTDLQSFPVALPGGINESSPNPSEQDLQELKNFAIFRNRVGLRAPLEVIATLQDDQGTPADVNNVLDIIDHQGKLWAASYSESQDDVYLHSMDVDGGNLTLETVLYSGVVSKPTIKLVSFTGGSETSPEARIYAVDYNQNLDTVYWEGSTVTNVTADLDGSGSAENLIFSLLHAYKFHLFGSGFLQDNVIRPELLRVSRPGTIPEDDPDDNIGTTKVEWWVNDFYELGRRGDKIRALARAGDRLIIFQERSTHVLFGSGTDTFSHQELSDVIGCVGPHAAATVDERVCYFWGTNGPYRTDGTQIQDIGTPIRQTVTEIDAAELDVQAGYSPDDGVVYFLVSEGGEDEYSLGLAFDHRRERWFEAEWLVGTSESAEFGALSFLDDAAAPAPEAAPSGVSATATSDTEIDVAWTNGDLNVNTRTHVYRSTSTGFTPLDTGNLVADLASGVSSFADSGLSAETEYFYKVRHIRNNTHSSESAQVSDTTWLAEPTNLGLAGLTDGLQVTGANNATGADIRIERKTSSGSFGLVTTLQNPGASFSHDDTGLDCGTEYFYRAMAQKAGEADSEWSETVSREACNATTAPTAPSGLAATAVGETQIDLAWNDNSDNEDNFRIERAPDSGGSPGTWSLLANKSANVTSHPDTGLDSDTTFHYRIRAENNAGESAFDGPVSATTDPNLDAPTDLTATTISSSQIDLSWTDTADDETAWEVEQSDAGADSWSQLSVNVTGTTTKEASIEGLSANKSYDFRVRATLGSTKGPYTDPPATATTDGNPPPAPSNLVATQNVTNPDSAIDLAWTDNSSTEDGFEIQRKVSGGNFNTITTEPADTESFPDTGLDAGITYTYRVRATDLSEDSSDWSNEDSASTSGASTVPADPTNFTATADDNDLNGIEVAAVDLSWTDNATNEEEYILERCKGSGCSNYVTIAELAEGTTSFRDVVADHPINNTIYNYRLRARNSVGDSNTVTSGDVTVEPECTPSSVTATDTSFCDSNDVANPEVTITWNEGDITGIQTREVQRSKDGGSTWTTVTTSPDTATSHEDTGVAFETGYIYRVIYDFGSSGENTGEFTSDNSNSVRPQSPDCSSTPLA